MPPARMIVWEKRTWRCRERSPSKERTLLIGIQRNGQSSAREAPRVGTVLAKSRNLASAFAEAEQDTSCSVRRSSPKRMVVFETSSGKNAKRKVAPILQISRRDRS
ncbi:hypothetical protein GW17_00025503 [Ensete ventricosum]|nr:hypothetical protein GW17_00025503 [Ensete ventricosum]